MRTETVLDILNQCYSSHRDRFQQVFQQQVLGMIVLTRYNNKTYRITDVDFTITPKSTFETRTGPTTYIEYYKKVRRNDFVLALICIVLAKFKA